MHRLAFEGCGLGGAEQGLFECLHLNTLNQDITKFTKHRPGKELSKPDLEITSQVKVMETQHISPLGNSNRVKTKITVLAPTQGCPDVGKKPQKHGLG